MPHAVDGALQEAVELLLRGPFRPVELGPVPALVLACAVGFLLVAQLDVAKAVYPHDPEVVVQRHAVEIFQRFLLGAVQRIEDDVVVALAVLQGVRPLVLDLLVAASLVDLGDDRGRARPLFAVAAVSSLDMPVLDLRVYGEVVVDRCLKDG